MNLPRNQKTIKNDNSNYINTKILIFIEYSFFIFLIFILFNIVPILLAEFLAAPFPYAEVFKIVCGKVTIPCPVT